MLTRMAKESGIVKDRFGSNAVVHPRPGEWRLL